MYDDFDKNTLGWGVDPEDGSELWDDRPIFGGDRVTKKDRLKLLFYPKKYVLYGWVKKAVRIRLKSIARDKEGVRRAVRIVDVGCGTGATVIDFKKMFGRNVEVIGVDVLQLQIDIAKERLKEYGVWADIYWYDGKTLPFSDESVDVIYTSDVLGHVEDVPAWTRELFRVLRPNGTLAVFAESAIGKHAFLRKYLSKKGVNIDPHAKSHISLYSKKELKTIFNNSGFTVHQMMSVFWAKWLAHPEEFDAALKKEKRFFVLRHVMGLLAAMKRKTYPYSTAAAELFGLVEMHTLGRFLESQGYAILAKKEAIGVPAEEDEKLVRNFTQLIPDLGGAERIAEDVVLE